MQRISLAAALLVTVSACGSPDPERQPDGGAGTTDGANTTMAPDQSSRVGALASLRTGDGENAGTATATEENGSVRISLQVQGLPQGAHGVHVHAAGQCEGPAFESAGGHWNPTSAQHGLEGSAGQHAGDMPNLEVGADGRGTLEYTLQGATFAGLLDRDGSAFVVHAEADDQTTDPSGNSGDRIACGVFARAS